MKRTERKRVFVEKHRECKKQEVMKELRVKVRTKSGDNLIYLGIIKPQFPG
jgi:hypothetical protein